MQKIILFLSSIALISSCSNQLDQVVKVNLPPFKKQIVMATQFNNEFSPTMNVSATKPLLSSGNIQILYGAQAKTFENDLEKGAWKLVPANGQFSNDSLYALTNFVPTPGNIYKTEVSFPGLPTVEAIDTMPTKIPFTVESTGNLKYIKIEDQFPGGGGGQAFYDTLGEFKITFTDPAGADYYRIFAKRIPSGLSDGGFLRQNNQNNRTNFYSEHPAFTEARGNNNNEPGSSELYFDINAFYFTDKYFSGSTSFKIYAPVSISYEYDPGNPQGQAKLVSSKYYIALQHHSKASYLYNKSIVAYKDIDGDPFAQPVLIYSNVKNGLGILCTSATSIDSVNLK